MLGLEAWLDIEAKFDWPRHQHLASVSVICHRVERGGRDNVEEFFLDSVLVFLPVAYATFWNRFSTIHFIGRPKLDFVFLEYLGQRTRYARETCNAIRQPDPLLTHVDRRAILLPV